MAEEQGGWHYEGDTPAAELERRYRSSPASWPDIQTFASGLFIWEQRVNL
jgi:hypothetical protein